MDGGQLDRDRDEGSAGGRRALRPPDEALEPEDEGVHLRRTQRHLHPRPRQDGQAVPRGRRVRQPASPPKAGRSCSSAPSGRRRTSIAEEAQRCGMFYVNERWLGGLLTNFATIQRSLGRLRDLEAMATDGRYDTLRRRKSRRHEKEKRKLLKNLEGIRGMARLPDARLRRRHAQGKDRGRRGAQAEDSGHRHRRHQLRSRRSRLRHPRQRRRAARDPAVRLAHRRRGHRRPRRARVGDGRAGGGARPKRRRPTTARRTVRPADIRRPQRAEPDAGADGVAPSATPSHAPAASRLGRRFRVRRRVQDAAPSRRPSVTMESEQWQSPQNR